MNENEETTYQNIWDAIQENLREIYSCKCLYWKQEKVSNQ